MQLIIKNLGGGHTDTCTHAHAVHKGNLVKLGMLQHVASMRLV